jgi:hypothetical protein
MKGRDFMFRNKKNLGRLTISLAFILAISSSFLQVASHAPQSSPVLDSSVYYLKSQDNPEGDPFWTTESMKVVPPVDRPPVSHMASNETLDDPVNPSAIRGEPIFPSGFSEPPSKLPLLTTGKLLITFPDGRRGACSGTVVASLNESVVNTAAHCLYNKRAGGVAEKVIFCPQYKSGDCPVGRWVAKSIIVNPRYKVTGNPRDDLGMIVVSPKKGKTIVDTVGGNGWMYNGARFTVEKPYGYPSNQKRGQILFTCPRTIGVSFRGSNNLSKLAECEMGPGSSGGPWYTVVNGVFYVNGHNDIGPLDSSFIVSPYYSKKWFTNFDRAQNIPITATPQVS